MKPLTLLLLTVALSISACMPKPDVNNTQNQSHDSQTATAPNHSVEQTIPNADSSSNCAGSANWLTPNSSLPTSVTDGDNCSFQQFAWQAFSYLLQMDSNTKQPRFLSWMPTGDIFVGKGQTPAPWSSQPKPDPMLCTQQRQAHPERLFLSQKMLDNVLDKQAGSNFPLIDQSKQYVYYYIQVNETNYNFINQCDLYQSNCAALIYDQYPSNGSGDNNYAALRFPAGAFVLKSAWMLNPNTPDDYFVIPGIIEDKCELVDLALVGIHVVGTTQVHKEFIWATFDHYRNAPDCGLVEAGTVPDNPKQAWNFYDPDCKNCPRNTYQAGKPTQVCRVHPYGESSVPEQDPENTTNMQQINQSMSDNIKANNTIADHWANYELTGNVWSKNGNLPATTNFQRGSLASANVSMETYVQKGVANINPAFNCMSCHNVETGTQGTGRDAVATQQTNAAVSHLFKQAQADTGGCSEGSLPAACTTKYVK
ncbi:hypothetical protein [uncultured Shewanella sp.]|uniref:hypothetical protein n=1 Tax=uncultured Shewanella sp. TaxID=173975 RepID=UPI0026348445|nr:hypothetical protein [uncultured Shewanella sp.]